MPWWRKTKAVEESPADPNMPVIRLEHVSKIFRGDASEETRALDEVSLDIGKGEFVAVSGPSGCGKSTFLSILALLDSPTSGRYWLNGRATDRLSPGERARVRNLDVGLIFQSFNLIADMTVYENVEYPLTVRGVDAPARKARVEHALERVGLAARARQRPTSFSGGHQQLVAVARAITGRPAVLLADEPTGNLDSHTGDEIIDLLCSLREERKVTLVIATHDLKVAARAPRTVQLVDGQIAQTG